MSTTQQTLSSKISHHGLPFAVRVTSAFGMLISVCRVLRNRIEINRLHELDDNQLRDIGLTRAEVQSALLGSSFFEDPSAHLTQSARRRARLAGSERHGG
ncbi:MAG: DUF1127 domain-containing protein [Rhizobium sp.]